MRIREAWATLLAIGLLVTSQVAFADVIISPVAATASSSTEGTAITSTIDHSGLSAGFISGVTDFDTYIGGNPTHSFLFTNEWFSEEDTTSATVTYDLGSVLTISRLALWNEDSSGIGSFNLFVSLDGAAFVSVLTGISPTDNPEGVDYGALIFSLGEQLARFVRLELSGCPQADPGSFSACAIGEAAFAQVVSAQPPVGTPAPGALVLVVTGLFALLRSRKRCE